MQNNLEDPAASQFHMERDARLGRYPDSGMARLAHGFLVESAREQYSYNFDWLSRPIIQYPQDMVAMQEIIWAVRPDLIIETGIAHGGSLIFSASMLALIEHCDALAAGRLLDPGKPERQVVAVDIDIRRHNRAAIEAHPFSNRIEMYQGSSTDPDIVGRITKRAKEANTVLVCLDSNHTHEHVLAELMAYAPLTSKDSYCVVFDTLIEDMPEDMYPDRPWGPGNSPKSAIRQYLDNLASGGGVGEDGAPLAFEVDERFDKKLLISVANGGYLRRV